MGEAYLRRKYGVIMLPPISVTESIEDTFNFDIERQSKLSKYDIRVLVSDSFNFDTASIEDSLAFTFAQIQDEFNLDSAQVVDILRYTFAQIQDSINFDTSEEVDALRYTFVTVDDSISFDTAEDVDALNFLFVQVEDSMAFDTSEIVDSLDYVFATISDEFNLDSATIISTNFPAVLPPTLSDVFNIGPESADITVTNNNNFYTYVYYSTVPTPESNDTTPDTNEPRILLAPSSFASGDSFTISIENNFTLEGNNNYTFYARAYDQPLNDSSSIVNKPFTTDKYTFEHNPKWVPGSVSTTETSITFAYENENSVSATLRVQVLDDGGGQAMDLLVETINAGQTLTFNSNDYNDSFTAGETYTFIAIFEKTDYYDSGTTTNNVTTDEVIVQTQAPTITTMGVGTTGASFRITNNDASTATIVWEVNDTTPDANTVTNVAPGTYASVNVTGLNANTSYTMYATAQASGETKSNVSSRAFTTAKFTTAQPSILNVNPDETSVSFSLRNNDGSTATIYYEINDTTPDANTVTVGSGSTVNRSLSGLSASTSYTLYARAQASGENRSGAVSSTFTTDAPPPPPQTQRPTISVISNTDTAVTFEITNNDSSQATIVYEIGDSTPDQSSIVVSGGGSTGPITRSGLSPSTSYTIYATAQASGETKSTVDSESFTTNAPPVQTYTVRAKLTIQPFQFAVTGVQWQLDNGSGYSYQGSPNLVSSNYSTLRSDVPSGTTLIMSYPSSFVYNGQTYTFINSEVNGSSADVASGYNVTGDADVELNYTTFGFG